MCSTQLPTTLILTSTTTLNQGKMRFQLNIIVILIFICVRECTMMDINLGDTELQKNILKFGYGINYKYKGSIFHSFDRFM